MIRIQRRFLAIMALMSTIRSQTMFSDAFFLATNLFLVSMFLPSVLHADVIISEVMYDPPGSDIQQEYIELQNTGSAPVDITKWK